MHIRANLLKQNGKCTLKGLQIVKVYERKRKKYSEAPDLVVNTNSMNWPLSYFSHLKMLKV